VRKNLKKSIVVLHGFARTPNELEEQNEKVKEAADKVRAKYPKEIEKLESDDGEYHHGFNSGVLAAVRYITRPQYGFPFLDT